MVLFMVLRIRPNHGLARRICAVGAPDHAVVIVRAPHDAVVVSSSPHDTGSPNDARSPNDAVVVIDPFHRPSAGTICAAACRSPHDVLRSAVSAGPWFPCGARIIARFRGTNHAPVD